MPPFRRAEIWSSLQAAGGARLAAIPDVVALQDTRKLSGEDELGLVLPRRSSAWGQLLEQRAIRVVYTDDSFDEWRITGITEERPENNRLLGTIAGEPPLLDLARVVITRTEADGAVIPDFEAIQLTPTEHLNSFILPALSADGLTYFALGTIDPTWPVDLVYNWDTPLAVCRRLAELTGAEFRVRRNGTTQYLIDLVTQIGGSAGIVDLRLGKNLRRTKRDRRTTEQVTRVYPKGTALDGISATMARALWEVVSVAGSVVRLKDTTGGDGPAQFASQLNGLYLRKTDGSFTLISVTTVISSAQTDVTVASATGISAGQRLEIRKTSTGEDLTYLEAPAQKTTYGLLVGVIDRPDIPATVNVVVNPAMRAWAGASSAPPDNWTKLGTPTITKTTTAGRWRVGGQSDRVQSTADGQGLETNYVTIAPTAAKPFGSGFISLWVDAGQVRVELVATDGTTTYVFPDGTDGKAFTNEQKRWIDLGVAGIDLKALNITQVKIRIVQDGTGTADFYVDSAQIIQEASQQPFIEGAGGTKLWQMANEHLVRFADPLVRYDIDILDLTRLNAAAWPNDELVLGGTVNVKDAGLGVTASTRVIELQRDLLKRGVTDIVLSSRPEDLTDALVRPRSAPRISRDPDANRDPEVESYFQPVASTPGTVKVTLGARPTSAKIFYQIIAAGSAVPPIGAASYIQYSTQLTVSQLQAQDQWVLAYAQLGTRFSSIRLLVVPRGTAPAVTLQITENPANTVIINWTLAGDVAFILLFRKKNGAGNGWPTTDNNLTGPLDYGATPFLGKWYPTADGGRQKADGTWAAGGQSFSEGGYAANDVVKVIAVGVDKNGVILSRVSASYTVAGVQPVLTSFTVVRTRDGTGCDSSTDAQNTISWTVNGSVLTTDHLKIWESINGAPEVLIYDADNPTSPLSKVNDEFEKYLAGGTNWTFDYRYELSRSSVVKDSGSTGIDYPISGTCPI